MKIIATLFAALLALTASAQPSTRSNPYGAFVIVSPDVSISIIHEVVSGLTLTNIGTVALVSGTSILGENGNVFGFKTNTAAHLDFPALSSSFWTGNSNTLSTNSWWCACFFSQTNQNSGGNPQFVCYGSDGTGLKGSRIRANWAATAVYAFDTQSNAVPFTFTTTTAVWSTNAFNLVVFGVDKSKGSTGSNFVANFNALIPAGIINWGTSSNINAILVPPSFGSRLGGGTSDTLLGCLGDIMLVPGTISSQTMSNLWVTGQKGRLPGFGRM